MERINLEITMKNIMKLETTEINPTATPKASVIWLHGLGASGDDFVDIVPQLHLPEDLAIRFIFPHAPIIPVTLNFGSQMRAWFDIYGLSRNSPLDKSGIEESKKNIENLITKELALGIESDKIILAGFSQGGALALHCGLNYPKKLAGILVLSGFLMFAEQLPKLKYSSNKKTPILVMHGEDDSIVPINWAKHSKEQLDEQNYNVKWEAFKMQHNVCMEEIKIISEWLQEILR